MTLAHFDMFVTILIAYSVAIKASEEGMETHSSILAWRIPMDRGAWWATVHGVAKSRLDMTEQLST